MTQPQRLYCYVDETGQDSASDLFVVVAIVREGDQDHFRRMLANVESAARTGQRKWHKSRPERRLKYLQIVLREKIGSGDVFFGKYAKPLPYFLPVLETVANALAKRQKGKYRATVFIDGIDRKKAAELTNALRVRGVRLEMVRSRRDESEPIIRLADMWAGCIRAATLADKRASQLVERAIRIGYLTELTKRKTPRGV